MIEKEEFKALLEQIRLYQYGAPGDGLARIIGTDDERAIANGNCCEYALKKGEFPLDDVRNAMDNYPELMPFFQSLYLLSRDVSQITQDDLDVFNPANNQLVIDGLEEVTSHGASGADTKARLVNAKLAAVDQETHEIAAISPLLCALSETPLEVVKQMAEEIQEEGKNSDSIVDRQIREVMEQVTSSDDSDDDINRFKAVVPTFQYTRFQPYKRNSDTDLVSNPHNVACNTIPFDNQHLLFSFISIKVP